MYKDPAQVQSNAAKPSPTSETLTGSSKVSLPQQQKAASASVCSSLTSNFTSKASNRETGLKTVPTEAFWKCILLAYGQQDIRLQRSLLSDRSPAE